MVQRRIRGGQRRWILAVLLLLAALLHVATWAGFGLGAFVLWDSIHAFYFQQSYAAGWLPLAAAGLIALAIILLLFRQLRWALVPATVALIVSLVILAQLGQSSPLAGFIHPMQVVPWSALALTWGGCIWLLVVARRRDAAGGTM